MQRSTGSTSRGQRRLIFLVLAAAVFFVNAWLMRRAPAALMDGSGLAPEWPVLVDALVTLPLLYLAFSWRDGWRAVRGALVVGLAGIALATWIVPAPNRDVLEWLAPLRYVVLAAIVLAECAAIIGVFAVIGRLRRDGVNVETAIDDSMRARFGAAPIARLLALDARMWFYALFASTRRPIEFPGDAHFSYHTKDGNASNQQGFIFLILVETPILHVLLTLFWNAQIAWIISALSLWGLAFLLAEYRATMLRPISLHGDELVIRHGLLVDVRVPLARIADVRSSNVVVARRLPGVLRYCESGTPNVRIEFDPPLDVMTLTGGSRRVERIFLGVDAPARLLACLGPRVAAAQRDAAVIRPKHEDNPEYVRSPPPRD